MSKRIGLVTYTARPPKGTSRKKRQAAWRTFLLTTKIINEMVERHRPQFNELERALLIHGQAYCRAEWDTGDLRIINPPYPDELLAALNEKEAPP